MSNSVLPELIAGRYRPVRLIGKGGMGAVYEVEHLHTGQHLALKVLSSQPGASVERFKREARAASLVHSDHIVRVTDADVAPELNGAPFLVMELLDGADLERATGNVPAAPADVVDWLRQVARALGRAHDAGLVHRDLKPENLFLTRRDDGTPLVKILDFGIAKMTVEVAGLTASDAFLGTPGYMAPEQTDSRGPPITPRADLYALGLIAFKLLTGHAYWVTGSLAQLLAQILAEPMPPASERGATLGPAFDAWFARACDRNPEKRFASAEEQIEALAEALSLPRQPVADTPTTGGGRRSPAGMDRRAASSLNGSSTDLLGARKRVTRQRLLGGGLVAVVAAVGVVAAVSRGGPARPPVSGAQTASLSSAPPLPLSAAVPAPAAPPPANPAVASASAPSAIPSASSRALPRRPPASPAASTAAPTPSAAPSRSAPPASPPAPPAGSGDPLGKLRPL